MDLKNTGLGLALYIGFRLEIYSDYITGLGLTLWYIDLGLEKYSNQLTGTGLTLWYIGLELEKH